MKHYKRKFKGYVINFKKVKNFMLLIFIFSFCVYLILNLKMTSINANMLKACISANFLDYKNDFLKINISLSSEALIKNALPYIEESITDNKNEIAEILPEKEMIDDKNDNTETEKIISQNLNIKNETNYDVDINSLLSDPPSFNLEENKPLVLIVHTHASESFTSNGEFETMDTDRTLDSKYNMIRIGEEFVKILSENGINVVHDKTIHDYPSYTSSYKRTLETIENNLEKYPSIKIVLDIHRDALIKDDGTKIKLSTNINGVETAQVMILCGTNEGGLEFDTWNENLKFALQIQKTMEDNYPTLARPLVLSKNRYNMHKTKGSLLFEIGTNGNTLYEAINGAKLMADSLVKTIKSLS